MRVLSPTMASVMALLTSKVSAFTRIVPSHTKSMAIHSSQMALKMAAITADSIKTKSVGTEGTEDFRIWFTDGSNEISPWHDIPLEAGKGTYHFVNEIPKMTKAKMEVATKEANNPIAQDEKKGKPRFYHGPIFWNYGCLPQTWENPNAEHPELKVNGDDDPVDVVEIGSSRLEMGAVVEVKPLGVLAMIDDGELDWKVIAINVNDPLAKDLNDVADVEAKLPGTISGIREWFRWYKTPDDKPINAFGFDEKCLGAEKAVEVIKETHMDWKGLMDGSIDGGKLWKGKEAQ